MENEKQLWDLWFSAKQKFARNGTVFVGADGQIERRPGHSYVSMILKSGDVYKYTDISLAGKPPLGAKEYDDMQKVAIGVDLEGAEFINTEFMFLGVMSAAKAAGKNTFG